MTKATLTPTLEADLADHTAELRNPALAALLAWLIPGAGHLYQGRTRKGLLYMICILGTFFYGLYLGNGTVVYASWRPNDQRWPYFCQIGAGLVALPALLQADRAKSGAGPLFGWNVMVPPKLAGGDDDGKGPDDSARWNYRLHRYFELGTVYTMIAGLLNLLAVYDAFAGPVPPEVPPEDDADDNSADKK